VSKQKTLWEHLGDIDSRIIYAIVFILIAIPFLSPIGLPLTVSNKTREVYALIDKLPPASVVVVEADISTSMYGELEPLAIAVWKHLLSKDLKIVLVSFLDDGPIAWSWILRDVKPENYGKKYGEDWVQFGFIPGGEPAIAAFAKDMLGTARVDYYGNDVSKLPMMANIKSATDVKLVVDMCQWTDFVHFTVRQWNVPYGIPIIEITGSGVLVALIPYYPKMIAGYLLGVRSAAEYEKLIGFRGLGVAYMDIYNVINLYLLLLILLGSISVWHRTWRARVRQEKRA